MYYFLHEAAQNLVVQELRAFWSRHPRWQDFVDNIQSVYSFKERIQHGAVVRVSGANPVRLSADNFLGTEVSYVGLATIPGHSGESVEWVREDAMAIRANGGEYPSLPGVYYCEVHDDSGSFSLYVTPLLDVRYEIPSPLTDTEYGIAQTVLSGSLRVYELPEGRLLREGSDYTYDSNPPRVILSETLPPKVYLSADYRYSTPTVGPFPIQAQRGYPGIIPGAVLVFGRCLKGGDRFAVVVSESREETAEVFGGRFEMSLDIDIVTRDSNARSELVDRTMMFLLTEFRDRVVTQGVDVSEVNMGGTSEDTYDENGDDYFYNATVSMSMSTDWQTFRPIVGRIASYSGSTQILPMKFQLQPYRDPFFASRLTYPTIL